VTAKSSARSGVASLVAVLLGVSSLTAQMTGTPTPGYRPEPGAVASSIPKPLREIGFDQNLDLPLPLDAEFRDERGDHVQLGRYFGRKPVVLAFVYYECPMICTQVIRAVTSSVGVLSLEPGKDFEVVMVSFDPRETPARALAKKTELVRDARAGAGDGWHFLTGDEREIKRVTAAAGFRYAWDAETQQYAHPTGILVVTPDGRPARYLFGIEYGPRDLRFALLEASEGRVGSTVDSLLLYCFHYDPMTGRYGVYIMRTLRIAGAATVLLLGTFIFIMVRRERFLPKPGAQA
jgi:protein SCO1